MAKKAESAPSQAPTQAAPQPPSAQAPTPSIIPPGPTVSLSDNLRQRIEAAKHRKEVGKLEFMAEREVVDEISARPPPKEQGQDPAAASRAAEKAHDQVETDPEVTSDEEVSPLGFLSEADNSWRDELESQKKSLEERVAELEVYEQRYGLKLQDLIDNADLLSKEERRTIAEVLIYSLDPDNAAPELKSKVGKLKGERERAKIVQEAEAERAKVKQLEEQYKQELALVEYRAETKYLVSNLSEFPSVQAWFGDNKEALQNEIFEAAAHLARNGAKSSDDIAPQKILSLMEDHLSRRTKTPTQKKSEQQRPASTAPGKVKPLSFRDKVALGKKSFLRGD